MERERERERYQQVSQGIYRGSRKGLFWKPTRLRYRRRPTPPAGRPVAPGRGPERGRKGEGSPSQRRRGWGRDGRRREEAQQPYGLPTGRAEEPGLAAESGRSALRPGPAPTGGGVARGPQPPPPPSPPPGAARAERGPPPQERARRRGGLPRGAGGAAGPTPPARPGRAGPWGLSAAASPSPCRPGVGTWTGSCSTVILLSPASAAASSSSSPSPERGGPGPASVRVPAAARRGPAPAHLNSQRPLPGQAAGREGTRPAKRRVRPKLAAEIPERAAGNTRRPRRKEPSADGKQLGKPPRPSAGRKRRALGGAARARAEIAERRRAGRERALRGLRPLGPAAAPASPRCP